MGGAPWGPARWLVATPCFVVGEFFFWGGAGRTCNWESWARHGSRLTDDRLQFPHPCWIIHDPPFPPNLASHLLWGWEESHLILHPHPPEQGPNGGQGS